MKHKDSESEEKIRDLSDKVLELERKLVSIVIIPLILT